MSQPRVLLIDEDGDHRRHCARLLRETGFEVHETGDASTEPLDDVIASCDAALLDDTSRGLAGRIRSTGATVFGMTDIYLGDLNRELAILRDGFAEFWEKPVLDDELLGWLRRSLGERFPRAAAAPAAPAAANSEKAEEAARPAYAEEREAEDATPPPPYARRQAATTSPTPAAPPPRPRPSQATPRVETPIPARLRTGSMPRVAHPPAQPAPTPAGEPVVPPRLDVREVGESGEFGGHALSTVLASLAYRRATGALMLQRDDDKRLIYMEQGFAVGGRSNHPSNGLGPMLVSMGLIPAKTLQRIDAHAHEARRTLSEVLLEQRVFTSDEMDLLWSVNLRNRAVDVFDWRDGVFSFREGTSAPVHHRHDPVISPMDMIWEGVQFGMRLRTVRAELEPFLQHVLVWANDPLEKGTIRLTPSQELLLDRIDERTSMMDLTREGRVNADVQRFLFLLVSTGFLAFVR